MPIIRSQALVVHCDEQWPRIFSLTYGSHNTIIHGCEADRPFTLEINGASYNQTQLTCEVKADDTSSTYTVAISELSLTLVFRFAVQANELHITLPTVQEDGAFRLETLYIPEHRLLTGYAEQNDSYLRAVGWGGNWQKAWCPGQGGGGWEDMGPISEGRTDYGPMPTAYACLWNESVCAAIMTSIRSTPLMSFLSPEQQCAHERAGLFTLWAGRYAYRLQGKLAAPFLIRIALLDNDPQTSPCALAANWQADQLQPELDRYHETLVYKLFLDDFRLETPTRTFAGCLEIIQRIAQVSGGLRQIAYLVGWQDRGHDSGYPWPAMVNPRLGGEEELRKLIEEAQKYNCIISMHANVDDSYEENPGHRPDLISRGPSGDPYVWFVNYEVNGRRVYSLNHTLAMETGFHQQQVERFLELVPLHTSIHFDAHRPCNEVWLPDGTHINSECEWQLGLTALQRWCQERGIDITVEGASPLTLDLYTFSRNRPGWHSRYQTVMTHGRMRFECASGPEVEGLGMYTVCDERAKETYTSLQHKFYTFWMYAEILHRKRMLRYEIGSWNEGIEAWYKDDTYIRSGRPGASPLHIFTQYEGIPIARGGNRFLPWRDDVIYAYSTSDTEQEWLLPATWEKAKITALQLAEDRVGQPLAFTIDQRTIRFQLPAHTAARFTRVALAE